jgi:L-ascorbate metabolism protein UlaG (beta-lactamase superfamily)
MLIGCNEEMINEVIEAPVVEAIQEETVTLHILGRASVRLDFSSGMVVYIDPYSGSATDYEPEADLVLVTHQHTDHNVVDKVTLKEDGEIIACPTNIKAGDSKTMKGLEIIAVEAYNDNHLSRRCCGYIIKYNDIVIYHSGDTSTTKEMERLAEYNIDYALLCMDGFYNMGPDEAMAVADLIDTQIVIPIHTSGDHSYDQRKVDAFTHDSKVVVKPGESLQLSDISKVSVPFEDAIEDIIKDRLTAIETKDYDLYMASITKRNPYLFNEQERWFMGMTDEIISDVSFEIKSTEMIDEHTAVVNIIQKHYMDKSYELSYPLLFKYEKGMWKDHGYNFEVLETERFTIKYMKGETRVEEFRQMLEDAFVNLDGLYEEKPHPYFEMKLFSDREMLRQRTIPSNGWLFTGWSEPDESLKLFTGHPESYIGYPGVVQHEVVHHISIRMCNNNLAVWLLEGIAMYDGSAHYGFESSSLLSKMRISGVKKSIAELEAIDFSSNLSGDEIANFYNNSYMYVRYISEIYGHDTLMALFKEAGKKPFHDSTLNESFEKNNQISTGEVIQEVLKVSKQELSDAYLEWLVTVDIF